VCVVPSDDVSEDMRKMVGKGFDGPGRNRCGEKERVKKVTVEVINVRTSSEA
jgi:hypothetical protein